MQFTATVGRMAGGVYEIDVSTLPTTFQDKRYRGMGVFLMVFALLWGGLPTLFLIRALLLGDFEAAMLFILMFTVIGGILFCVGLKFATTRRVIGFSETAIRLDERSVFGAKLWEEPFANFMGVRSRSVYHSGGKNSSGYTTYTLELHHTDRKKRLKLYESRSSEGLRTKQQNYCRQLHLPALEGDDEANLTVRQVDELGKSVGELAREGRIKVDFDPSKSPPVGIHLEVVEDQLRITLPKSPTQWAGIVIGCIVAGVFTLVGFILPDVPFFVGLIGAGFFVVMLGGFVWTYITRQIVTVAPGFLRIARMTPWGETKGTHMDASDIQTIRLGKRIHNQGAVALLVGQDDLPYAIGSGLPKETLEWLRSCLLAVMARGASDA